MSNVALATDIIARDRASAVYERFGRTVGRTGDAVEKTSSHFGKLGAFLAGGAVVGGLAKLGTMGIQTAASMEQARIAFTTMLGSGQKADKFLKQLQVFAAKTPFEFPELQTAASSLISVGVNARDVIPIMTTLGNVTSGMGTGAEGVKRATVALQQMIAAQRISGQDLNQLRDAGIPVYDLLAKATGKSTAAVVKMAQAGKLGKKELTEMLDALKSGKGMERFAGLMDKQSASLSGLFSTLKDTVNMSLANLVAPAIPAIKSGLAEVTKLTAVVGPALARGFRAVGPKLSAGFRAALSGVQTVIDKYSPDVKKFAGNIRDGLVNAGGVLIAGVKTGLDTGDWSPLGQSIGRALAAAVSGAGSAFGKIADALGEQLGKLDWVGIGVSMGKQVPSLLLGLAAGILNFDLGGLLKGLAKHWQDVLFAVLALAFAPAKFLGKVGELLGRVPLVGKLLEWAFAHMVKFSKGLVGMVGDALKGLGSAFVRGLLGREVEVGRAFGRFFGKLIDGLFTQGIKLNVAAGKLVVKMGEGFVKAAEGLGGLVRRAVGKIGGWVLDGVKGAGKWLLSAGKDVIGGFIHGITSMGGQIIGAIKSTITDHIPGYVKKALGIASPSRVFMKIGSDTIAGLIVGIKNGKAGVTQALGNVVASGIHFAVDVHGKNAMSAAKTLVDALKTAAARAMAPLNNAIEASKNRLATLKENAKQLAATARDNAKSYASILGFQSEDDKPATAGDILKSMADRLAKVQQFRATLAHLAKMGLNKTTYREILEGGVDQGGAIAAALEQGGKGAVGQANTLQAQINAESAALGNAGADKLYGDAIAKERKELNKLNAQKSVVMHQIVNLHVNSGVAGDPIKIAKEIQKMLLELKHKTGVSLGIA